MMSFMRAPYEAMSRAPRAVRALYAQDTAPTLMICAATYAMPFDALLVTCHERMRLRDATLQARGRCACRRGCPMVMPTAHEAVKRLRQPAAISRCVEAYAQRTPARVTSPARLMRCRRAFTMPSARAEVCRHIRHGSAAQTAMPGGGYSRDRPSSAPCALRRAFAIAAAFAHAYDFHDGCRSRPSRRAMPRARFITLRQRFITRYARQVIEEARGCRAYDLSPALSEEHAGVTFFFFASPDYFKRC